jgi:hypothetical protein
MDKGVRPAGHRGNKLGCLYGGFNVRFAQWGAQGSGLIFIVTRVLMVCFMNVVPDFSS